MRLVPETNRGWGLYAMFVLGVLSWIAGLLSAPEWIGWALFVPFIVVSIWVIVGFWKGEV